MSEARYFNVNGANKTCRSCALKLAKNANFKQILKAVSAFSIHCCYKPNKI